MSVELSQNRSIFSLSVGDIGVSVDCGDTDLVAELKHRYKYFPLVGEVHFHTHMRIDEEWIGTSAREQQLVMKNGILHIQTGMLHGSIDVKRGDGELVISYTCPSGEIEYYFRAVFSLLAFQMGGLLLHAAGIVRDGWAYVFFGHSGTGKTTVAKLSQDTGVLNDDLVLLALRENEWRAFPTPFWNPGWSECKNKAAPIKALFCLVQDQEVFIEDMDKGIAIAEMVSNVPVVPLNHPYTYELIERCVQIIDHLDVYRLHFRKDPSFWEVIEQKVLAGA